VFKNTASQKVTVSAIDTATGGPKTGDAGNITVYVSKDDGSVTALTDTSAAEADATNAPGDYLFDLTQAETNADKLRFTGKSATSGVIIVPQTIYTRPPNFPALAIDSNGRVKVQFAFNKNVAAPVAPFYMTTTDAQGVSSPATGATVTCSISKDGGAFAATATASATEIGYGWYYVPLTSGEMNATQIELRATASGCDDGGCMIQTFA
jgi:hypothetical protein